MKYLLSQVTKERARKEVPTPRFEFGESLQRSTHSSWWLWRELKQKRTVSQVAVVKNCPLCQLISGSSQRSTYSALSVWGEIVKRYPVNQWMLRVFAKKYPLCEGAKTKLSFTQPGAWGEFVINHIFSQVTVLRVSEELSTHSVDFCKTTQAPLSKVGVVRVSQGVLK